MNLPFEEIQIDNDSYVRTFCSTNSDDFLWHRDQEDRYVSLVSGIGWYVQFDNELPKEMIIDEVIEIKKYSWHRIICMNSSVTAIIKIIKKL